MGKVIGIDLGTTNSVVAFVESGTPQVIINEEGSRQTPSVVGFSVEGERVVGDIAKRQLVMFPENTVHSAKRFIGRSLEDASGDAARVAYSIVDAGDGHAGVQLGDKIYTPQQISAFIVQKLKKSAEDFLGEAVTEAVITVPAYFSDSMRQATRDAGTIAGLNVLRIINEPTAAALAYTYKKKAEATIAVFDFGGGTFDISILHVEEDVAEVRATAGNSHLGGNDLDDRIVEWLFDEFKKAHGTDMRGDRMIRQRLIEAAEKAKKDLSSSLESEIHLPFLTADANGPQHLQVSLSRSTFEFLVADLLDATIAECRKALTEAKLKSGSIDEVILVGGSSRIPKVQEAIRELFGCPLNKSFNPDEVVAVGAAIQGGMLGGTVEDVTLLDVTNFSLGIETEGRRFAKLIPKGSTIPVVRSQMVSTVIDNQRTVKIHVLQGEEPLATDNISLGQFELTGIEPADRGAPRIEVLFTINTDGIVSVSGRDVRTGVQQSIRIHSPSAMSTKAIEEAQGELANMDEADEVNEALEERRIEVEKHLFSLENFVRANKPSLQKREVFDTEQALKRGRMALIKRADPDSLSELADYLIDYLDHLRERVRAVEANEEGAGLTLDGVQVD